jgi:hypothetical protein
MKRVQFPKRIKRGSCVVTIYKTLAKGYGSFTVVHYGADGARCRRTFADYKRARQAAVETADKLSEGQSDMLVLAGQNCLPQKLECLVGALCPRNRTGHPVC